MKNGIHFLIIGLCSGILLGLSMSPVVESALSLLITFVVTLMGIACGVTVLNSTTKLKYQINPSPLSATMFALLVGALIGIFMRTHNALGMNIPKSSLSPEMQRYMDSVKIANNVTGVHASAQDIPCYKIRTLHGDALKFELQKIGDKSISKSLEISSDSVSLEILKEMVCPSE